MTDFKDKTGIAPQIRDMLPDLDVDELDRLDGMLSSAAELNLLDGATVGTVVASKAVIASANKDVSSFRNLTATGAATLGSVVTAAVTGPTTMSGTFTVPTAVVTSVGATTSGLPPAITGTSAGFAYGQTAATITTLSTSATGTEVSTAVNALIAAQRAFGISNT